MNNGNKYFELMVMLDDVIRSKIGEKYVFFVEWFENWFIQNELSLEDEDNKLFLEVQDFYSSVGFYEPDEKLRKDHASYYGDGVLHENLLKLRNNIA